MTRVKKSKAKSRLQREAQRVRDVMQGITDGTLDPYLGFRELYIIFCRTSGIHDQLRNFFRAVGVEPDGPFQVDEAFRRKVRELAAEWITREVRSGGGPVC
jgi:hypothetical protein